MRREIRACVAGVCGSILLASVAACPPADYGMVESLWLWTPARLQGVERLEQRVAVSAGSRVHTRLAVGRWTVAVVRDPDVERCGGAYVLFDDGNAGFADAVGCGPRPDAPPDGPRNDPASVRVRRLGEEGDRSWIVAEWTSSESVGGCAERVTMARVYELGPTGVARRIDVLVGMRRVDVNECTAPERDFAQALEGAGGERFRLRAVRGETLEGNRWQLGTWTISGFARVMDVFRRNASTRGAEAWWMREGARSSVRDAIATAGGSEPQLAEFDRAYPSD